MRLKLLFERLTYLIEEILDISKGCVPIKLSPNIIRVSNLSKRPILGGMMPNRGTLEIFKDITRESLLHVTTSDLAQKIYKITIWSS